MTTSTKTLPEIPNLLQMDKLGDTILPMLDSLREAEPIVWSDATQAWLVLRHADVLAGFKGKHPLSNHAITPRAFSAIPDEEQATRLPVITGNVYSWMINSDPPEHRRLRNVMMKGFTPSVIEASRPFVRKVMVHALDIASANPECEIIDDVMREVTVATIMHLMGLPSEELANVKQCSDKIAAAFTRPQASMTAQLLEKAEEGFAEMSRLFREAIAARRASPSGDFLSQLVAATEQGALMSEDELIGQLLLLLPSGHESTTNTMALILVVLLRNPGIRKEFLESTNRTQALNELMRFVAMSTVMNRTATEDFVWHGCNIKKGDRVLLVIASANRDPSQFEDPTEIQLRRSQGEPLVFGYGIHHCIGHLLAKMETTEFLTAILERFPKLELCDATVQWTPALTFRGLSYLNVRWNSAPAESVALGGG